MSDLLPDPPPRARRYHWWVLLGVAVVALAMMVAAFFFARRQIGEFFARRLGERLAEDGVFIGWKSSDWVPGGGILMRGMALYRDAAKQDRLALLGVVTAKRGDPSWTRWDKVDFKAEDTQLVLGSGETETKLDRMEVLLLLRPGQIDLREFHASLQGLRIEVKFALVDKPPAENAEAAAASRRLARSEGLFRDVDLDWLKLVKEWVRIQPENNEPVLRMELDSVPDDGGLTLALTFDGSKFRWRGQVWDFLQAAAKIPVGREDARIDVDHIRIGHGGRKSEIAAAFDPASRVIRISKLDSGIDVLALARAMMPEAVGRLSAASTTGAWRISGEGEIPVDHPENFRWAGHSALDGDLILARGESKIELQKPTFSVRVENQTVNISDLKATLWEGNLHAPRMVIRPPAEEKKVQIETELTLDGARPSAIARTLDATGNPPAAFPLDWTGAWRIKGTAEIPVEQPQNSIWNGEVALDGDLVYASGPINIALQKPAFSARAEEQVVTLSDFRAGLWEGSLKAPKMKVHLPSKDKKVRFETQLTLDGARPSTVRRSFSAGQKQPRVSRLKWTGTWRINGTGEVPLDHPENFHWDVGVAVGGDLGYTSGDTNVALQKPTFALRLEQKLVSISDFKAGLWQGSLTAPRLLVHLPSAKTKAGFETHLTLSGARLQSIISSFGSVQKQPGIVQSDWKIGGGFDLASLAGSGALSITQAEFCRMPIVGPLHLIFDKLTPKFRKDEPSTMTVNHRLAGGILHLDDMKLVSEQARVEADGTIDLAREYAKITATGRLRKIPGLATRLVTSLLTFNGEGPVDDIRWSLKNLPGIELFGKSATKAVSAQTDTEKKPGRALKGLIRLPGRVIRDE